MGGKVLRIVLIGAGSREFSRGLVNDLVLEEALLSERETELWMVDIDPAALDVMYAYAQRAVRHRGVSVKVFRTTDRREALPGADYVLLAVELKRMELWEQDFRLPVALGMRHAYGENGGPGALFHTLRNYEIIFPILEDIERLCPEALLLNFTNPEARILKAILTLTKVRAIGLCHGFHDFHRLVERMTGRRAADLDIRTAGMNHLFAYYRIVDPTSGEDLAPAFEAALRARSGELPPLARYIWETFGVIGMDSDHHIGEYIPYAPEFLGLSWLFGIEEQALRSGKRAGSAAVDSNVRFQAWRYHIPVAEYLEKRPDRRIDEILSGAASLVDSDIESSGELAVPVIADIELDRKKLRSAVNVLNADLFIPNLDREACVEIPATVDAGGIHPEHVPPLPEGFAAQLRLQGSIQAIVVEAYRQRSRKLLLQALLLDPGITSARAAERYLEVAFDLQADFLASWR